MFGRGNYMPYNMPYQGGFFRMPSYSQTINPNLLTNPTLARGLARGSGGLMSNLGRSGGLFSRLRNGINWSGFLNNAGRTLDVINRAIPVVKQAGPMFNNMKTMFRLASAFKDESDHTSNSPVEENIHSFTNETVEEKNQNTKLEKTPNDTSHSDSSIIENSKTINSKSSSSSPNFFI